MKKPYQICIFDLDGTLLDSKRGFAIALNQALSEHKIFLSDDYLASFIGPPIRTILKKALPDIPEHLVEPIVARYREVFDAKECLNAKLYNGVHEVLSSFIDNQILLILATNKPRRATNLVIDHFDIKKYFASVVCPDPNSNFNLTKKELIVKALEKVDIPKKYLLVVGDTLEDFEAAQFVQGDFAAALYGYGGESLKSKPSAMSLKKLEDICLFINAK